jgi:hypothetical protein
MSRERLLCSMARSVAVSRPARTTTASCTMAVAAITRPLTPAARTRPPLQRDARSATASCSTSTMSVGHDVGIGKSRQAALLDPVDHLELGSRLTSSLSRASLGAAHRQHAFHNEHVLR